MLKMAILSVLIIPLFFLCISGQQLLQIITLHHNASTPELPQQPISHTLGVSVDQEKLHEVSTSILMAEKWLRNHVLSYYPSINITSIVVSNSLLCDENQEEIRILVLASMENVHHSLVRWGLNKKIKVSVSFTPKCLHQSYLKPVFEFLAEINSTFTVESDDFTGQYVGILSSYLKSMADLGVFRSKSMNILQQANPISRKLLFIVRSSSEGTEYSVPSDAAGTPLPPLVGFTTPPPLSSPEIQSPVNSPPPYYGLNLPPCNPYPSHHHRRGGGGGAMAAPPTVRGGAAAPVGFERLWCVAKPSVPSEKLQEAIDYACGEGGADCEAISPAGSCYFPDSVVAHASYAFNSYWQKNKKNGGTCGFGGTAMLINSDPSFLHCRFINGG